MLTAVRVATQLPTILELSIVTLLKRFSVQKQMRASIFRISIRASMPFSDKYYMYTSVQHDIRRTPYYHLRSVINGRYYVHSQTTFIDRSAHSFSAYPHAQSASTCFYYSMYTTPYFPLPSFSYLSCMRHNIGSIPIPELSHLYVPFVSVL